MHGRSVSVPSTIPGPLPTAYEARFGPLVIDDVWATVELAIHTGGAGPTIAMLDPRRAKRTTPLRDYHHSCARFSYTRSTCPTGTTTLPYPGYSFGADTSVEIDSMNLLQVPGVRRRLHFDASSQSHQQSDALRDDGSPGPSARNCGSSSTVRPPDKPWARSANSTCMSTLQTLSR